MAEYGKAKKLISGLTDLNYEPGHGEHMCYKYLLGSNDKNDTALLEAYQTEEIYSRYIIWVKEKGFTLVSHPSEIYGIPDTHEYIDGNQPLRLIIDIDARQKPDPTNLKFPSFRW